jgi:phosphoenolpyruvate carboxykinase (GTP)
MMEVPSLYAQKGYKIRCISDDVAWLKKGSDGRLWAINPETGIFGTIPGITSEKSPNILATAQKDTIFTNVVHNSQDNTVWWEGLSQPANDNLFDWKGNAWSPPEISETPEITQTIEEHEFPDDFEEFDTDEVVVKPSAGNYKLLIAKRGAHPNSRFTAPISGCPNLSPAYSSPSGVPISAIIFGGRRSKTVPLVYQAFDWEHGVFVGTVLGTEPVTANGSTPAIRRDPMAMLNYCGYNMADYWQHWLKMGKKLGRNAPKIFNVNWFKNGDDGTPIWPGFGENIRVLDWIIRRIKSKCTIIETPVGYSPKPEDINIEGLDLDIEALRRLLYVEKAAWKEDVNSIKQFYAKFGDKLPEKLKEQLIDLEKRLMNA